MRPVELKENTEIKKKRCAPFKTNLESLSLGRGLGKSKEDSINKVTIFPEMLAVKSTVYR